MLSALGAMALTLPLGLAAADRAGVTRWALALVALGAGAWLQAALVRWVLPRLGTTEGIPSLTTLMIPGTLVAALTGTAAAVVLGGVGTAVAALVAVGVWIAVSIWLLPARLGAVQVRIDGLGDDLGASVPAASTPAQPIPDGAPGAPATPAPPPADPAPTPVTPGDGHAAPVPESTPLLGVETLLADALVAGLDAAQVAGVALAGSDTQARVDARNHCAHQGAVWGGRLASVPGGPDEQRVRATAMVAALVTAGQSRSEPEFLAALAQLADVGEAALADPGTVGFIATHRTPGDPPVA